MKGFKGLVKDINVSLDQILFFDTLIKSIVIFLVGYFILALFNFYPLVAIIPSVGYFFLYVLRGISSYKPKLIESKYTELKDKLSAAVDNIDQDNPVMNALQEEIMRDARHVELSSFLESKNLSANMLISIIMCVGIILTGIYNVQFVDVSTVIEESNFLGNFGGLLPDGVQGDPGDTGGTGGNDNIFGEESLLNLGDDDLDIVIQQSNYEIFTGEIEDAPDEEFGSIFPDETCADDPEGCGSSDVFENDIPLDQQELVKNYFLNVVQG